ncbi:MAG TPA: hypothetical protein VF705_03380, partial [Longimicrobium sp.]
MKIHRIVPVLAGVLAAHGQAAGQLSRVLPPNPDEPHLRNVRQLTFGGENAEAYFSSDGGQLIFQSTRPGGRPCDEIFTM